MKSMKRKDYQKPMVTTIKLQPKCQILNGTNTPPPAPEYDDWFGWFGQRYACWQVAWRLPASQIRSMIIMSQAIQRKKACKPWQLPKHSPPSTVLYIMLDKRQYIVAGAMLFQERNRFKSLQTFLQTLKTDLDKCKSSCKYSKQIWINANALANVQNRFG